MGRRSQMRMEEILREERDHIAYHLHEGDELLGVFQTSQLRPFTSRLMVTRELVGAGLDYGTAYTFKPKNVYKRSDLVAVTYSQGDNVSLTSKDGRTTNLRLLYADELGKLREILPPIPAEIPHTPIPTPNTQAFRPPEPARTNQTFRPPEPVKQQDASIVQGLTELVRMRDQGALTEDEFRQAKRRLLGS